MLAEQGQPYEIWRPTLSAIQRMRLLELHHAVGAKLRKSMGSLGGFEPQPGVFVRVAQIDAEDDALVLARAFSLEKAPAAGLLAIDAVLARRFVDFNLGLSAGAGDQPRRTFTSIEAVIAEEAATLVFEALAEACDHAGLGRATLTHRASRLHDLTLFFDPGDYMIVTRLVGGPAGSEGRILIALETGFLNLLRDKTEANKPREQIPGRPALDDLPVDAEVVLGIWQSAVGELGRMRPGDRVLLPDPVECILRARNHDLMPVATSFGPDGVRLRLRRRFAGDEQA